MRKAFVSILNNSSWVDPPVAFSECLACKQNASYNGNEIARILKRQLSPEGAVVLNGGKQVPITAAGTARPYTAF